MRKAIRHFRDCMQSDQEDCLAGDLEAVSRNLDLYRKRRMI